MSQRRDSLDRRSFVKLGALAAGLAATPPLFGSEGDGKPEGAEAAAGGMRYRVLGKTGLKVSEIAFGTYGFDNPALLSAALDSGINLLCTCADYQGGRAERATGKALAKLGARRDELVLMSGTSVTKKTRAAEILATIDASLQRLQTDRIEIFRSHNVKDTENLVVDELFEAFESAKKAGKVQHLGLSGHKGGLQECLRAAILDGRFEVFLCKYDFVSYPDQAAIFKLAAAKGIGTIVFKTKAGARENEIRDLEKGGLSFTQATTKWALSSPHVTSVCAGISSFKQIEEYTGAVGRRLSRAEVGMLEKYARAVDREYCRFCGTCEAFCPHGVAVADVMRYSMYFRSYKREKDSMELYQALPASTRASACKSCDGACRQACPFGREIRGGLVQAHADLSLHGETGRA